MSSLFLVADDATFETYAEYIQNSDNAPGALVDVEFNATLNYYTPPGITVTMTPPGSSTALAMQAFGLAGWNYEEDFGSSLASFEQTFPNGTYTFNVSDGTVLTSILQGNFPTEPIFTGTTLAGIASVDPSQPYTVFFNGLGAEGQADSGIGLFLTDLTTSMDRGFNVNSSANEFTLPANILTPGDEYELTLYYGLSNGQYYAETKADFTVAAAPEPSELAYAGLGMVALILGRRLFRRAEIN